MGANWRVGWTFYTRSRRRRRIIVALAVVDELLSQPDHMFDDAAKIRLDIGWLLVLTEAERAAERAALGERRGSTVS